MKLLESQPERYDRGISWLSFGQARRIKQRITDDLVSPDMEILDIGSGTGTFAIMSARKGARVTGFDVSAGMLQVAEKKIRAEGLFDRIELLEMGISGMDHFKDLSFDLVVSTLVFSELSPDELRYALKHSYRLLKPGGRIVIADEVRPKGPAKRFLHSVVRLPMLIVTFAITQTATRALHGLEEGIRETGFIIESVELTSLDSFLFVVAVKEK